MDDVQAGARTHTPDEPGPARQAVNQTTDAARQAAGSVTDTARQQASRVGSEISTQARSVATDVRDRVAEQAHVQNNRLVDGIRRLADELDEMSADRKEDSPAATMVRRIADTGRQTADLLAERGPEGILDEVQEFARRRPGAFLAAALATGFVVGRLGKGVLRAGHTGGGSGHADRTAPLPRMSPDAAYSAPGYAAPEQAYSTPGYSTYPDQAYRAEGQQTTEYPPQPGYQGTTTTGYGTKAGYGTETGYPTATDAATDSTQYAATGTGEPVRVERQFATDPDDDQVATRPVPRDPWQEGGPR